MPKITVQNLDNKTVPVSDASKPLLYHFQQQAMDWMHACGGKGRCTTCKVIILDGKEDFLEPTEAEQRYFRLGALKENERLACQACIRGDVRVAVPEASKLPHIKYSG